MSDKEHQKAVIADALGKIFVEGGWCVFVDDVQYLTDILHLGDMLRMIWYQARSLGLSLLAATQRPRRLPVEMWTQSLIARRPPRFFCTNPGRGFVDR
jgi:hypothetical protein